MPTAYTADELSERSLRLSARLNEEGTEAEVAFYQVHEFIADIAKSGAVVHDVWERHALQTMLESWLVLVEPLGEALGRVLPPPSLHDPSDAALADFRRRRDRTRRGGRPPVHPISRAQFEDFLASERRTLEDVLVTGIAIAEIDFRERHILNCRFEQCDFPRAQFDQDSNLAHSGFVDCNLAGAQGGDHRGGLLAFNALFERVRFDGAAMELALFNHAAFVETEFDADASFRRCQFYDAKFQRFRSNGALLAECLFDTAKHDARDSYMDFSESDLSQSTFREADLARVVFAESSLRQCRFDRAVLTDARFEGADVFDADFRTAHYIHRTNLYAAENWTEVRLDERFRARLERKQRREGAPKEFPVEGLH
jgi:uncharacterized protein YjbI with pentapeptide repeats